MTGLGSMLRCCLLANELVTTRSASQRKCRRIGVIVPLLERGDQLLCSNVDVVFAGPRDVVKQCATKLKRSVRCG